MFDQWMFGNISFTIHKEEDQKSLVAGTSISIQNLLKCTSMNVCRLIHMVTSSIVIGSLNYGVCFYSGMDFVRRVFDRGRSLESIRSTKFCPDTLAPCMFVRNGSKLVVSCSGNVFLIVTNDGDIEACELFDETVQQVMFSVLF